MKEVRVLVVEEEKKQKFEEILPQDEYIVLKATGGKRVIKMVKEEKPDLMVLDMELSGMNGIELLRKLQISNLNIPVIAVSATGTVEAAVEAMKFGACDYLTKPLNMGELGIAVRKGLQVVRQTQESKGTNFLDIQTLIDEVKERMLERGANLEEARKSFEKRLLSIILGKANGNETKIGKLLGINRESIAF